MIGIATVGFLPYALIVTDPAAIDPGMKPAEIYAYFAASDAEVAGAISTLLVARIDELLILYVYGAVVPDQDATASVTEKDLSQSFAILFLFVVTCVPIPLTVPSRSLRFVFVDSKLLFRD